MMNIIKNALFTVGSKVKHRDGFILIYAMLFLNISLFCGTFLLSSLVEQQNRINGEWQQMISRRMSESGWNLALDHLQQGNKDDVLNWDTENGTVLVTIQAVNESIFQIASVGTSGEYTDHISGIVEVERYVEEMDDMDISADGNIEESENVDNESGFITDEMDSSLIEDSDDDIGVENIRLHVLSRSFG